MQTDAELLRCFAFEGSEPAFTEFVQRHTRLVFSIALRLTHGSESLAKDAAQMVFLDSIRKAASLHAHKNIVAWLHTSTRFAASKILRAERTRRNLEAKAEMMNRLLMPASNSATWDELCPVIDEALGALNEEDRAVILLRFFEQRTLGELAHELGCREEAARKRVARALEKLRRLLERRGLTTATATLALILTEEAVSATPTGLAGWFASACFRSAESGGGGIGISNLILLMKTKTIFVALIFLAIGTWSIIRFAQNQKSRIVISASKTSEPERQLVKQQSLRKAGTARSTFAEIDSELQAALGKVHAALHETGNTRRYPQSAMEEAIAGLGEKRRLALPILREGMEDIDPQVRRRSLHALGLLGKEAEEIVADLLDILLTTTSESDSAAICYSLERIHLYPEMAATLVDTISNNPVGRLGVANLLASMSTGAIPYLETLFENPDSEVQLFGAYVASQIMSDKITPEAIDIALHALKSGNDDQRRMAMSILENAKPASQSELRGSPLEKAVPALKEFLTASSQPDLKMQAKRLLNTILPANFIEANEGSNSAKSDEFIRKVQSGQATVPELVASLSDMPQAAIASANALGEIGYKGFGPTNREDLINPLNGLREMLNDPDPAARIIAATSIKKLQPMSPKMIYTQSEIAQAFEAVQAAPGALPEERRLRVQAAVDIFIEMQKAAWKGKGPVSLTPYGLVRYFASALKEADRSSYDKFVNAMNKVDPEFLPAK